MGSWAVNFSQAELEEFFLDGSSKGPILILPGALLGVNEGGPPLPLWRPDLYTSAYSSGLMVGLYPPGQKTQVHAPDDRAGSRTLALMWSAPLPRGYPGKTQVTDQLKRKDSGLNMGQLNCQK